MQTRQANVIVHPCALSAQGKEKDEQWYLYVHTVKDDHSTELKINPHFPRGCDSAKEEIYRNDKVGDAYFFKVIGLKDSTNGTEFGKVNHLVAGKEHGPRKYLNGRMDTYCGKL